MYMFCPKCGPKTGAVVLKLEVHQNHFGGLLKHRLLKKEKKKKEKERKHPPPKKNTKEKKQKTQTNKQPKNTCF